MICCAKPKDNDYDSYGDDIPIQPYRESKDLYGQRKDYYQGSNNPGYNRSEIENGDQGYTLYRGRGAGTEPGYLNPYQGRTDHYTGPPTGYDNRR